MRTVRFNLIDRLVLTPVEVVHTFMPFVLIASVLYLLGGWFNVWWALSAWLAASVLFLVCLPWIPTRAFSTKGLILGALVALPFTAYQILSGGQSTAHILMRVIPIGLITTALISYFALNLTGTTPITSWTSVQREIKKYIPVLAMMAGVGITLEILFVFGLGT